MNIRTTIHAASLAFAAMLATPPALADSGSFVQVSDIHFNPFDPPLRARALADMPIGDWTAYFAADPTQRLARWGEDTNHGLLATSLAELAKAATGADFVLVTGDLIAHRFPDNVEHVFGFAQRSKANDAFAVKTTLFVAESLRAAAAGKPVFVTLGNNDSSCGDYETEPGGSYLAETREAVRSLAGTERVAADFDETYLAGGYYAAAHPTLPDTTILVLDDTLWSVRYRNACGTTGLEGANAMMGWLEKQLAAAQAAGRKVWLAHHMPIGFDAFATIHNKAASCQASIVPMLAEPYASQLVALLARYGGSTITASFSGHIHHDDYRLLRDATGTVTGAEKVVPAISPIYGNNPGFHIFRYDRASGVLSDFSTRYLANLATAQDPASADWQEEYVFSAAYGAKGFSAAAVETLWKTFAAQGGADATFRRLYNASHEELPAKGIEAFICAMGHVDAAGFTACYCGE